MKIVFLTASVSRAAGGVFDAIRRLASELAAAGSGIEVFGLRDPQTEADLPAWDGLLVRTWSALRPRSFGYAPGFALALAHSQADLVHAHGLWMYPSVACLRSSGRTRRPYIVSPHGMLDPWAFNHHRWKKALAGWLYENLHLRQATCLHALCDAEARAIRAYGLLNPIGVIPNGVDLPVAASSDPPVWHTPVPESSEVLLYLGRLHLKKGLVNLLRAWRLIQADHRAIGWHLVIAGWDQTGHEGELRQLACELSVEQTVSFPGPQFGAQKDAAFRRASAFVLPSFSEGLPVTVLEAWAYGQPVVMTPHCNLPEGFQAGAAVRVDPDPHSIARGLAGLFAASSAERREMGERGRRLVAERFSWPKIAAQMKHVYEWVLGGGSRPDCVLT